jgi:hypothetical protein
MNIMAMTVTKPLILDLRHDHGQVGEVQGAGKPVEQADSREEENGRDQVQRDVFHAAVDLLLAPAQDEQAEGRDEHDLEPDIEVEQVAG